MNLSARPEINTDCCLYLDAGSDAANLSTEAVLDGDCYIVNGRKAW